MSTWYLLFLIGCPPPEYEAPAEVEDTNVEDTAPPPPNIRLIFPQSSTVDVYCPLFTAVVDVDNYLLSEENYGLSPTEGEGHWHLKEGATLLGATADEFLDLVVPLQDGAHNLVAVLVGNDHQELSSDASGLSWLAEITVEATEGCLGDQGGIPADTGS